MLARYERVLVPEMNLGQLLKLVRAEFLVDAVGYNRVRGVPFRSASELAGQRSGTLHECVTRDDGRQRQRQAER